MNIPSNRVFAILVAILTCLAIASIFFPPLPELVPSDANMSTTKMVLLTLVTTPLIYGGLGYLGLWLSRDLGFPDLWDSKVNHHQRFVLPLVAGTVVGCVMVAVDAVITPLHDLGPLPHPVFPISILASGAAGIGEELLFRLFFVSFWMWVLSRPFKGKHLDRIFWVVAVLSALAFAGGHLPAAPLILDIESLAEIPGPMMAEIFLLNGLLSLVAAYGFRRYGFLAAVGVHFWADMIWHVAWGVL